MWRMRNTAGKRWIMSLFNWMKKAVKVVDKMATEAAEKPDIEKPRKTMSTVPNPDNNSYLERWNNRKPPEFIELEMPELAFQSRFDFSKVRGFDFGMENNQISIFIDGKNQMIAREDISSMNVFLNQGHMDDSDVPLFKILEESIRFEPSLSGMDDYTRLIILPLTPTGKKPKYPLEMKVCLLSQDEHWKILQNTCKEIFGDIWYLNDGKIGKARIICWNYAGRNSRCYIFQIRRGENGLFLQKVDKPVQPL